MSQDQLTIDDLLFLGFNRRVIALDKRTGDTIWNWKAPHGTSFVTLLIDGDMLFASVQGYTYGLDPVTGQQLWYNSLKGMGTGAASLATTTAVSNSALLGAAAAQARQQAAATGGGMGVVGVMGS